MKKRKHLSTQTQIILARLNAIDAQLKRNEEDMEKTKCQQEGGKQLHFLRGWSESLLRHKANMYQKLELEDPAAAKARRSKMIVNYEKHI